MNMRRVLCYKRVMTDETSTDKATDGERIAKVLARAGVASRRHCEELMLAGEVEVDNALGLPAVPGVPQLANGTSTIRVWSGGEDRGRVAIP